MSFFERKRPLLVIFSVALLISVIITIPDKDYLDDNFSESLHSDSNDTSPIQGHTFLNFSGPISMQTLK